jgi:sugar lactone lactonase YvrE
MTQIEVCPIVGGGPEDILVLPNGDVITGTIDGRLQKIRADFSGGDTVAQMDQRALGMDVLPDGRVVFCDPTDGVFAVDLESGQVRALATQYNGVALGLCNNPSVAADGTVYFSVSSTRNNVFEAIKDVVEAIPTGALYRVGADGVVEKLLGDLLFANGVTVAPDQQSVLVAETGRAKITRVWIDGPKSGTAEVFAQDMAGTPDNLALSDDGSLLVAWVQPYGKKMKDIMALPQWMRWLIVRLPKFVQPKPDDRFMMARYGFDGVLLGSIDLEGAGFHFVTGGRQVGDWVYVGSVEEDAIARFPYAALEG